MDTNEFQTLLRSKGACDEARDWVNGHHMRQAYEKCERPDWILWMAGRMAGTPGFPTVEQIILAACDCAETALKYVPEGEERPKKAIEAARAYAKNPSAGAAGAAARAAWAAGAAAGAAGAAGAAARAAGAAARAAAGAAGAAGAAAEAAWAAAEAAANKEMCDLIRARFNLKWKRRAIHP